MQYMKVMLMQMHMLLLLSFIVPLRHFFSCCKNESLLEFHCIPAKLKQAKITKICKQ